MFSSLIFFKTTSKSIWKSYGADVTREESNIKGKHNHRNESKERLVCWEKLIIWWHFLIKGRLAFSVKRKWWVGYSFKVQIVTNKSPTQTWAQKTKCPTFLSFNFYTFNWWSFTWRYMLWQTTGWPCFSVKSVPRVRKNLWKIDVSLHSVPSGTPTTFFHWLSSLCDGLRRKAWTARSLVL